MSVPCPGKHQIHPPTRFWGDDRRATSRWPFDCPLSLLRPVLFSGQAHALAAFSPSAPGWAEAPSQWDSTVQFPPPLGGLIVRYYFLASVLFNFQKMNFYLGVCGSVVVFLRVFFFFNQTLKYLASHFSCPLRMGLMIEV